MKVKKPLTQQLTFSEKSMPINYEQERSKFLFDQNYNPQFTYEQPPTEDELLRHGRVDGSHLPVAKRILDKVIEEYGSEENFQEKNEGRLLSEEETMSAIQAYLQNNKVEEVVSVELKSRAAARTLLKREKDRFILQLRTPVIYREHALQGMLHHEIGIHLFRWLNEMSQPWFGQKSSYQFQTPYLTTEEGLATIHSKIDQEAPYLWGAALNYYAVSLACEKSFSKLNAALKKYIADPEKRWQTCLKVKRGLQDTSEPGCYTKNKVYLEGALQVASWLHANNYQIEKMFIGKVSIDDLELAWQKSKPQPLILPQFLAKETYLSSLKRVIKVNRL